MLASGFCTGAAGMGHVAITSCHPDTMLAFWQQIFDARLSDRIEDRVSGLTMDFTFMRLNERHHSVAVAATRGIKLNPIRTRIHHLNIQPAQLEDLSAAYVRCRALGFRIANGVGQHPNDREVSFYVMSPPVSNWSTGGRRSQWTRTIDARFSPGYQRLGSHAERYRSHGQARGAGLCPAFAYSQRVPAF